MIQKISASDRHQADHGWLKTYHLFSFSSYQDPTNIRFGSLRVFNDDVIEPHTGFGTHPHSDMEIVTVLQKGELTHADSMGNSQQLGELDVQAMSAGTGITHSEHNQSDQPTHFYQIWIFTNKKGIAPCYAQKTFKRELRKNVLLPVASGRGLFGALPINSPSTVFLSELDKNKRIGIAPDQTRKMFIYLSDGEIRLNGETFYKNDQARIKNEHKLIIEAAKDSRFVLIDVPAPGLTD